MSFNSWLRNVLSVLAPGRIERKHRRRSLRATTHRPGLEVLEDRCLPSTFTVLNLLDSGPDSLRAAVAAANANPGADTIDFATTGTIALTSGQLDITDGLTINGPGASALTVSGEGVSRVFALAGDHTVVIADLTVANGWTSGSPGGGISMAGGTLTLSNCVLAGNTAVGEPNIFGDGRGIGGGLFVAGGTLTLDQCTVSANGAVGVYGFWLGNYSVGDGLGGGLCVAGGMVYVNQSTMSGNNARGGLGENYSGGYGGSAQGGGIFVGGGMVSVNQSTVSGNLAAGGTGGDAYYETYGGDGGSAEGGGIFVGGGRLEVHQSTLSSNTAVGGSGGSGPYNGVDGPGEGGGLSTPPDEPPYTYLDSFTVAHTIDNSPDDIVGTYFLDGMPRLAIGDVTVLEGNDGSTAFVFTVTRSGPSGQAVSVDYATADGTAAVGSDYQAAFGTLTIPAGQTTATITVQVNGDRKGEPSEFFVVNLSNATNATIADAQGVGTIVDDEPRVTIFGVGGDKEGNSGTRPFVFTVSLSNAYDEPVALTYATADGNATAGSDYQATSGTLTFATGETTKTITVLVNGDRLVESFYEDFFVDLSGATNAVITFSRGGATILDDEPRISISDAAKLEGKKGPKTFFTFTVTLSAAYDQAVTVSYRTVDATATTGDGDYVAKTGTLTFNPGETTKTITIEVKGDSKKEGDETFYLDLFGLSSNALFTKNRGLGTILNDD
jgi:hypothetical protein